MKSTVGGQAFLACCTFGKKNQFISVTMPYRVNVKSYKNFLTAVLPLFLICTSHFSFLPSPFFSFLSFNIFAWFHNTTSIKLTVKKLQVASVQSSFKSFKNYSSLKELLCLVSNRIKWVVQVFCCTFSGPQQFSLVHLVCWRLPDSQIWKTKQK